MIKKILAIRTNEYPHSATATRRFESFCHYLHEAGYEVTLLASMPTEPDMIGKKYFHSACHFNVIQIPVPRYKRKTFSRIETYLSRTLFPELQYSFAANNIIEATADRLLKKERFDFILTTYPPMGSLLVSDRLSRSYGIPWIADLRDIPDEIDVNRERLITRRSVSLITKACASSAHIFTVSEPLALRLCTEYDMQVPVTTIYNGFEESDFPAPVIHACANKFKITYCGSLGYGRDLTLLLCALDMLFNQGVDLQDVEIHIYGVSDISNINIGGWCSSQCIKCHGKVSHTESIIAQMDSAILLSLSSPKSKGILTSKIFEIAMIGRPVLSIPADGDVLDQFVRQANIGLASGDVSDVAEFLKHYLFEWKKEGRLPVTSPDSNYISGFSRRVQAAKVIDLIGGM